MSKYFCENVTLRVHLCLPVLPWDYIIAIWEVLPCPCFRLRSDQFSGGCKDECEEADHVTNKSIKPGEVSVVVTVLSATLEENAKDGHIGRRAGLKTTQVHDGKQLVYEEQRISALSC